jgi:crotonobetainyl-CoA:carnitine CoA-transferase CaiB-like acyl-CoA transferase
MESIRVLDLSSPVGAYCTRLLADLGAEVTLVEPPEGDPYRRQGPFRSATSDSATSLSFGYYQAGKHSIVLDTADATDLATLESLGAASDVVVVSPTPSRPVPGLDPSTGRCDWTDRNAIVCSITPYGVSGPYARRPATHLTSFAQSGQMWRVGGPGEPPKPVPANLHWHLASAHAAIAILAALEVRPSDGGQFIDISAQEVEQFHDVLYESYHAQGLRPEGRSIGIGVPPSGVWECSDGLFDIAAHQEEHWAAFLEMLDHPEELAEPSLADMTVRHQIFDGLVELIAPLLARRSRYELFEKGQRAGLPVCLMNTPAQFVTDEQLAARDFWVDLGREETGAIRAPGPAVRTSPTLFEPPGPAPLRDEHGSRLRERTSPSSSWSPSGGDLPRRPLEGLRVLSLGTFVAGNTTALILAGLGADVVKIESRSRPSVVRNAPYNDARQLAVEPSGATNTPMYESFSRGVLGVAVEMGDPRGRDVFRQLAETSDVVIENFGATVMAKWGLAYDDLKQLNPRIILASLSGYGRTGPRADYLAYGSNIANFTGIGHVWWTSPTYSDYTTATHAALAILAARRHVEATDGGVFIDAAQIEVVASMGASLYLEVLQGEPTPGAEGRSSGDGSLLAHVFRCGGDDRWAAVEATTLDEWNAVCEVIERADLQAGSETDARARRAKLIEALETWASARTTITAGHVLCGAGVPAASVANNEESYYDPQLHYRRFPTYSDHPDLGHISNPGSPHRLSVTPGGFDRVGPRVGQHTREVLQRWIDMSDTRIDSLIADGLAFETPRE